ncbi:hypothetical protein GCM10009827_070130 [Dactylosporangium maewongense]|uniref:Uncharacterized protein n=1 Tax=Dactylosporangium maewongense TaxID=634393 RepID=A0ABN2BH76_9ACTN
MATSRCRTSSWTCCDAAAGGWQAVAAADAIQDAYWQAHAIAGLAWHLPPDERTRAVAALTIATPDP